MYLPLNNKVAVAKLSAVFNSTSASYKFYWFLATLESFEDGDLGEVFTSEKFTNFIDELYWELYE